MSGHSPAEPANALADTRRIVIVGPCASGKSTLAAALLARGYDARVTGQEHSVVAALWQRSRPDVLVVLDADISAVRARRDESWPEWLHDLQVARLKHASAAADLRIDTSRIPADQVADMVVAFLESHLGD